MTINKQSKKKNDTVQEICCRKGSQLTMALLLPMVIIGGYFCPKLGFTVVGLITLFLILSSQRGRFYCGWLCPMGAFHERFLSKVSLHRPVPLFFKSSWFRWLVFVVMMGFMMSRLWVAWGDLKAVGSVFRTMWIVSMTLAIGLGVYFRARAWCIICPMGAMQGVVSNKTYLLTVADTCVQCKKCQRVCPIATYPGGFKKEAGLFQVPSIDCLRCFNCVTNCPKKALSFQGALDSAKK